MAKDLDLPELNGPRLAPAAGGKPERLIVLVHGYGADGQDLIGLGSHWASLLPTTAFVAPNAPERCPGSPNGFQWFALARIDPNELWNGVQVAGPILDAFITAELARLDLDDSQCALVGFSQGTMLSLHVGVRRQKQLACIVGYSGTLAGPENLATEIQTRPPVFLAHGDADPVVPPQATPNAAAALEAAGVNVSWQFSRGVGHGIAPDMFEAGGQFLVKNLA